jgi:hypothetical protein
MRKNSIPATAIVPSEDDIREYAYHLYFQNGSVPGRDLDNWLEARACLCACIPPDQSRTRLHHHLRRMDRKPAVAKSRGATTLAS